MDPSEQPPVPLPVAPLSYTLPGYKRNRFINPRRAVIELIVVKIILIAAGLALIGIGVVKDFASWPMGVIGAIFIGMGYVLGALAEIISLLSGR